MFGGVFLLVLLPPLSTKTRDFDKDVVLRRQCSHNTMAGIDHALEGIPRCAFLNAMRVMRRFGTRFDTTLIRFCQTHLLTFFCSSFARCARQQRIWDIQNRRHIRAPQREEVTDDGTDYEVHFVKARYAIRDVDAMRRLSLSLSLSLSRAFFLHTTSAAAAFALGGGGLVPFRSFFFLSLSLPPWSNRTRVPLLTECSRM